jgi:predicted RNA-binding protein with PIN domain
MTTSEPSVREHTVTDAKRNRLLATVVRLGREELADREPDQVPHKMRPVARSTGRGLPAPLQKSLLDFLATDEDFRRSVAERFEEQSIQDPIAEAFLADPNDAAGLIDARLRTDDVELLTSELKASATLISELEAKLDVAKERMDGLRTQHDADLSAQASASRRARHGLERQLADAVETASILKAENGVLERTVSQVSAALSEVRERLARRDERETRRQQSTAAHATTPESLPTDPVELAAMLDDLERKLHFYRESIVEVADAETSRNPLALPGGVSPESADALSALLSQKPDTVLIDGYNVVGAVSESLIGSRLGRDDVVARAEAVKRRVPETEVIVVFDAAQSGGSGGFRSGWGVLVEFEPKTTADDAIVELVHGGIDQCVVITNDRELQDRSARPGCVVVFSTALISWTEHLNGKSN